MPKISKNKIIINILEELKNGDRTDQMYYLAFLKEIGSLGKNLYLATKDEKIKKSLFNLKSYIEKYEL